MEFITRNGIKLIIGLKLLILSFILVDSTDLIQFGEKLTMASDDDSSEEEDKEFLDDEGETRRKSFFDELLTLPKVDADQTKKDELAKYFSIIERKSRQVEDRIKMLRVKQKQLENLESSIDDKLGRLEEEMSYFQQTQQKEKEVKKERLDSLVEFYKKMPAKKAAPVFEKLDKDLVVELFNAIPKKQTMNILSLMAPDKSVEISEYYGRIKSAKEYELLKEVNSALVKEFEKCKTEPM